MKKALVGICILIPLALAIMACHGGEPAPGGLRPEEAGLEAIDFVAWARITATGTRSTFLGLWPRETDDAPYTVRDGDVATGWKPPPAGPQHLMVDFAPLLPAAPVLASLSAEWSREPEGTVSVRTYRHCGGPLVRTYDWSDPSEPLVLDPPVEARCVELRLFDAGPAELTELRTFAAPAETAPSVRDVRVIPLPDGLEIAWQNRGEEPAPVQIHYVRDPSVPLSGATLIDTVCGLTRWEGPRPALKEVRAVLVPLSPNGEAGPAHVVPVPAREGSTLQRSGLVEGFYGRPWSHAERRALVLHMARTGLGLYIYGPKNDPLHRDEWRLPYDGEAVVRFVELRRLGEILGVTLSFGLSPGIDMEIGNPRERAALLAKIEPLIAGGFRHVTLLFDDIEFEADVTVDGALAREHVDLANWAAAELSALAGGPVELWFVPTVYSTERRRRWPGGPAYLDALSGLEAGIMVMWTGTATFSPTLEAADLADVTARIGRRPVIWDNEHATDGGDFFVGKVYLAPYENRSPDLVGAVEGIVANPMILGAANRLMLGTYAAFLTDPASYDPYEAREWGIGIVAADERDRALALRLAETFHGSGVFGIPGINLPSNPSMDQAIGCFESAVGSGSLSAILEAGALLLEVAGDMATAQSDLHHSGLDVSLVDDLWVPADRLGHEGRALLWLLRWSGSVLSGAPDGAALGWADEYLRRALFDRYQLSLFKVEGLRRHLEENPPPALGFSAPAIVDPDAPPRAGESWTYRPCEGAEIAIHGLPGSQIEDGVAYWTPPHAGVYHCVVAASNEQGWAWRELEVVVYDGGGKGCPYYNRLSAPVGARFIAPVSRV